MSYLQNKLNNKRQIMVKNDIFWLRFVLGIDDSNLSKTVEIKIKAFLITF